MGSRITGIELECTHTISGVFISIIHIIILMNQISYHDNIFSS